MENKNYRGKLGEDFVSDYLFNKGIPVLERNFRTPFGEIDIIAEEKGKLRFIEVKTRLEDSLYEPLEAVNLRKQKRIISAALEYMNKNPCDMEVSFDVYEVICKRGEYFSVKKLKIHRDAFGE